MPDASLLFFPLFFYAVMAAIPLALALFVAPGGGNSGALRSSADRMRQVIAVALATFGLCNPWWWRLVETAKQEASIREHAGLLQDVCKAKAREVTNRTVSGVHELDIRLPRRSALRDSHKEPAEIITPLHSRDLVASTWEAPSLGNARFTQVVIEEPVMNGGVELHSPSQNPGGYPLGNLDAGTVSPRYALSWDYVQTVDEQRSGLVGVVTRVTDTATGTVLAQKTTYFLRKERAIYEGQVNAMADGCNNAILGRVGNQATFIENSFDWVRRVL